MSAPGEWRVAGPRGRSTAVAAAGPIDAPTPPADPPPPPSCHRGRGPRPHAAAVADAAAAVRALTGSVAASPSWRRLRARLVEAGEDADAEGGSGSWGLDRVATILVLGLGRVAPAPGPPRAQAAAALLLADAVAGARADGRPPRVVAADPAFERADVDALTTLGWAVLAPPAAVEDAVRSLTASAGDCMLAYLPHCDPPIVERLLAATWTPALLPRVALVCNSVTGLLAKWGPDPASVPRGVVACSDPAAPRPARCLALAALAAEPHSSVVEAVVAGPVPGAGDTHGAAFNDTVVVVVARWDERLERAV